MADKNWGIKIYCECGAKYYSMNKKDKITCPVCSAEYIQEDLNLRTTPVVAPKPEPKKKTILKILMMLRMIALKMILSVWMIKKRLKILTKNLSQTKA